MKLKTNLQPLRGQLDLTPLIDVVLLLLIFFVLGSSFIVQPGYRIDPPRSPHGAGAQSNRWIVTVALEPLRLDASGREVAGERKASLFFNDQLMTLAELQEAFNKLTKGRGAPPVILRADRAVSLGLMSDIVNAAQSAGLSIVVATKRENERP